MDLSESRESPIQQSDDALMRRGRGKTHVEFAPEELSPRAVIRAGAELVVRQNDPVDHRAPTIRRRAPSRPQSISCPESVPR
jgi:hypothetical protein